VILTFLHSWQKTLQSHAQRNCGETIPICSPQCVALLWRLFFNRASAVNEDLEPQSLLLQLHQPSTSVVRSIFEQLNDRVSKRASCAKILQALAVQKTALCSKNAMHSAEPFVSHLELC